MRKLPSFITMEEFSTLIKHTKKQHHKIAFLLGFGSGLRISEVTNLKPEQVNIKERKILIKEGKGMKDRVVPLPKGFKQSHLKYLPIKCGVRSLQRAFKRNSEKAGLLKTKPDLHFHSLRHSFGTRCVDQGIPIHHVRNLMGHSNISTTNIYLIANPKDTLEKYEELF